VLMFVGVKPAVTTTRDVRPYVTLTTQETP
jgi:hypothetical protein